MGSIKYLLLLNLVSVLAISAFSQKKKADLIVYNAKIYTVDQQFSIASAMVINNGKIIVTGNSKKLLNLFDAKESLDARGATIYPGFIDAHAHFLGYGLSLQRVNLVGTESWEEVISRTKKFTATKNIQGHEWISGRGWDQNDWIEKEFPTKEKLDEAFPNNPVLLTRIDGHAAIANQKALELAGVTPNSKISGGEVEIKNGNLTGLLIDNAIDLVSSKIPASSPEQIANALKEAQQKCFEVGLTSVTDCGIDYPTIGLMKGLHEIGALQMRIYAMLSDDKRNFAWAAKNGKIKTPWLNVSSFKVYADGALGSRGACLLHPYSDKPEWTGFLLSTQQHFDSVAGLLYKLNWQMNTHAIGDSGNRTILNIYGKYLKGKNDRRWRIEHSQVVNKNDFGLFGRYNVIPSVQPTHATSDMYWAGDRLGEQRVKGAYAFKDLMLQNGWIPLGTDFPVEDISPFKTFYAAVFRKDAKGYPGNGYQIENALSRKDAIKGMTIWAAKAQFEEAEKGSLEKGKLADFIILNKDLMTADEKEILSTSVIATYVAGKRVYHDKNL